MSEEEWRRLPPPKPTGHSAVHITVRVDGVRTSYRWLPYKADYRRQTGLEGRWQVATEYGWRNDDLPKTGEWTTP